MSYSDFWNRRFLNGFGPAVLGMVGVAAVLVWVMQ